MSQSQLTFSPGVAFQQLGDDQDGVMMSLSSGYLYRCNRTASVVLAAIAAGKSLDDAATALCQKFGVDADRVRQDVEALVETLRQRKLLCVAA
jgi:hypothetical protein